MRFPRAFDAPCLMSLFLLVTRLGVDAAAVPRHLVYPPPASGAPTKVQLIFGLGIPMEVDVSTIVGYVMKCNYNLPYNASYLYEPYVRRQRSTAREDLTDEMGSRLLDAEEGATAGVGRYEIYKMLESAIDPVSQSGKACLLRAICEAAATPLNSSDGLFAQLLHIFLTPSTTMESYKDPIDQEYLAAESIGLSLGSECSRTFKECRSNFMEYFSKIH